MAILSDKAKTRARYTGARSAVLACSSIQSNPGTVEEAGRALQLAREIAGSLAQAQAPASHGGAGWYEADRAFTAQVEECAAHAVGAWFFNVAWRLARLQVRA